MIAPAEGADAALIFVPAVEAATVLAATVHSIVPADEAAHALAVVPGVKEVAPAHVIAPRRSLLLSSP